MQNCVIVTLLFLNQKMALLPCVVALLSGLAVGVTGDDDIGKYVIADSAVDSQFHVGSGTQPPIPVSSNWYFLKRALIVVSTNTDSLLYMYLVIPTVP